MGRGISISACLCNRRRRLSGPLSADQHRCRWEVKKLPCDEGSEAAGDSAGRRPPLSESVCGFITHASPSRMPRAAPSPLRDCSSEDGVGSDKVPGLIDGQSWALDERMDEGRGGSLTQANTERQRGTTCSAMQPLTAPQQFSPPPTTPVHSFFSVWVNNCDSM